MKNILPKPSALLILFALAVFCIPSSAGVQNTTRVSETVVFAVKKYPDSPNVQIEPIVIIKGGKYTYPPVDEENLSKKFTETYFSSGVRHRIVFGGGDAGTLTVTKVIEPGCVFLIAEAEAQTSVRLGGRLQALAVSSDKLGRGEVSRRAPTDIERTQALEIARTVYGQRKVPVALVKKMETVNLSATDLDRDGKVEMIGNFAIGGSNYVAYNLFVIFEQTAAGKYRAAWNWYHKGGEDAFEDRSLVDVLDLDGDGVAEVIGEGTYYESNDYVIYKRQGGTWRPIYKGGGGGC